VLSDKEFRKAGLYRFVAKPEYFVNSNQPRAVSKSIKPELKTTVTSGNFSIAQIERAYTRLDILPNLDKINIEDPEKFVESPWAVTKAPTVDPRDWDNATLETVNLADLYGTDSLLTRTKISKHIEATNAQPSSATQYPLVVVAEGRYTIVDGHHRLMAQWLLGQEQTAAWVLTLKGSK